MWFGTRGGLNRYDGYEFIHHKSKAYLENHLSNPSIETLFEDSKGNLWIGTKSGGLNFYDKRTEKFSQVTKFGKDNKPLNDPQIISIAETEDGNILVGTWSDGLYVLDFKNDSLHYLLNGIQVNDIHIDGKEFAWLATNGKFLRLNLKNYSIKEIDLGEPLNFTKSISDPDSDLLWITGWYGGLMSLNKKNMEWKRYMVNPNDISVKSSQNNTYSLLLDSQKRIWVGTWNGGLYLFDQKLEIFTKVEIEPKQIGSQNTDFDIILDIYEDNNKNIWIGTDSGGIVRIGNKQSFMVVSVDGNPDCGLKNFHISAFWKSPDGVLFVGTRGGGLYKTSDNKKFKLIPFSKSIGVSFIIRYITQISKNILWIGTGGDTYELDVSREKSILTPVRDKTIIEIQKLTAYLQLGTNLLIGTQQNGLYYFPEYFSGSRNFVNIRHYNNSVLKNDRINFIKKDLAGKIWIGTYKGIYSFDEETQQISSVNFMNQEQLTSDIIYCLHQTNDSVFWIGTPSGLNKLTKSENDLYHIKQYYLESGLPDDCIHGILSTNNKEIWMSTNSGLVKMNIETEQVFSFDKTDGLQGMIYSEDKGYLAPDGTLYFGGSKGYNYFKQENVILNKTIPPVVFTKFKIYDHKVSPMEEVNGKVLFDQPINSNPKISLTYKENEFTGTKPVCL